MAALAAAPLQRHGNDQKRQCEYTNGTRHLVGLLPDGLWCFRGSLDPPAGRAPLLISGTVFVLCREGEIASCR
ncbi:hypothetical protein PCLA_04f0509 [Pseudomonas citronellolis]|nr:hypothetical protein PCLA_04f0509 [Pseudomonas citronellolis]